MRITILLISLLFPSIIAKCQVVDEDHEEHHDQHSFEIGVAFGATPLLSENDMSWGFHIHLLKVFKNTERLKIGIGTENIIDEHTHINLNGIISIMVFNSLEFSISPGVLFIHEMDRWGKEFSSHFEVMYAFEVGRLHIGPIAEYSVSKSDMHFLFGVHLGIGF